MKGLAETHGAISIVNALAGGLGATVGVELRTKTEVEVEESKGIWDVELNGVSEKPEFASKAAEAAIMSLGKDPSIYSGTIKTNTEAPVGVGLKTSSSSSLAICLAVRAALGTVAFNPKQILDCSVTSSKASGATLTGALDDSASCLLGGVNFADNSKGLILESRPLNLNFDVLIGLPSRKSKRTEQSLASIKRFGSLANSIMRICEKGRLWSAMTLNGILYSAIYDYDPTSALVAVEVGALGAGLSGTGPAVAAVLDDRNKSNELERVWESEGMKVFQTRTTNAGARIG